MDHSETFLSSLAPSRDAIKEAKDMFANILDLSEAEKKEIWHYEKMQKNKRASNKEVFVQRQRVSSKFQQK